MNDHSLTSISGPIPDGLGITANFFWTTSLRLERVHSADPSHITTMDYETHNFRERVFGAHIQMSWAERIYEALRFVENHAEAIPYVGLVSYGSNALLVNSTICSKFFGIRKNSCNRNFQQHAFRIKQDQNIAAELSRRCPSLAGQECHWVKRVFEFGPFNPHSTPNDIERASAYARTVRSPGHSAPPVAVAVEVPARPVETEGQTVAEVEFGYDGDLQWFSLSDN
jgi:hypothetical protein